MPISAQSRCFRLTYVALAGSSPTRIVPSPGVTPDARSACTSPASSDLILAARAAPSSERAVVVLIRVVLYHACDECCCPNHTRPKHAQVGSRDRAIDSLAADRRDRAG